MLNAMTNRVSHKCEIRLNISAEVTKSLSFYDACIQNRYYGLYYTHLQVV
jgi:hypothetical protein